MPGESQQAPNTAPDPTVLTTEQLLREVEGATKLLRAEISALEAQIIGLENVARVELKSIQTQFALVERQRVELATNTEKAVQAALSAAKEAVKEQTTAFALATDKSERSMTEQLKQLNVTFTTAIGGAMDLLNDLKERVGRMESGKQAVTEQRTEQRLSLGAGIAIAGVMVSALGLIAVVAIALLA